MKKLFLIGTLLVIPSIASAQNQSISEFTINLTQSVTQLGIAAENLQKQNANLQKQIKDQQMEIAKLHTQLEAAHPAKKDTVKTPPAPVKK